MKKLFTLALVLLVATAGYSQARRISSHDALRQTRPMQITTGMESFENVMIEPNMTRTEGELDYTTYDWQSNAGPRTWTIVWPDGKINFAYTMATDNSFSDRGTGIGTYDYNNDEWIPLGGRIESDRTGFGSIARYKENGIVIAAHTNTQCGVFIVENKDELVPNSVGPASYLDGTYDPCWPSVMTSGPERDIIHVVVTANGADGAAVSVPGAEGAKTPIIYFRSTDGGLTWDKENVILPYMGSEYGLDWGSNICYWMETTEDNCLALVVNNSWSDCFVLCSYDNGETWEKKTFWHHPGINATIGDDDWMLYPRWTSAQWGVDGELCLAYAYNGTRGAAGDDGSYFPAIGGVAFWSENLPYHGESQPIFGADPTNPMPPTPGQPFIMDTAYISQDIHLSWMLWSNQSHEIWPEFMGYLAPLDDQGQPEGPLYDDITGWNIEDLTAHGSYNSGTVDFPVLCMLPDCNGFDMVAVWSGMDENNMDGNGNYYYKLFASYSGDGGRTWQQQIQLTTDFMYELSEFVYPQAAVIGTTLVVAVQSDGESGTFVQSDDTDASDNFYQGFTFELNDLFESVGVPEVESHNTHMSVYPNPATDQLGITLSQNADIVIYNIMGQAVMTVEGHVGANTLNISNLTSGIYFVNAGTETQKVIVR